MSTQQGAQPDRSFLARYGATILRGGIASIPSALFRYQSELHLPPQLVWFITAILARKWDADLPYPSIRRMAEETGVSARQLHTYKATLEEAGWLVVTNRRTALGGKDTNYYDFSPLLARLEQLLERDRPNTQGDMNPTADAHLNPGSHTHVNPTSHTHVNGTSHVIEEAFEEPSPKNQGYDPSIDRQGAHAENFGDEETQSSEARARRTRYGLQRVGEYLDQLTPGKRPEETNQSTPNQRAFYSGDLASAGIPNPTGEGGETARVRRARSVTENAPTTDQSRGVAAHHPEPEDGQNRILARQGAQPEQPARPSATATNSAESLTTHPTSSHTAPLSSSSARQALASSPAPASEQASNGKVGRGRGVPMSPERVAIAAYLTDFCAELGDQAKPNASITRALRIYERAGLTDIGHFTGLLVHARRVTQEHTDSIRRRALAEGKPPTERLNKMRFYFAVLEQLCGLRAAPEFPEQRSNQANPETALKSPAGGTATPPRKSLLHPKYAAANKRILANSLGSDG